MKLLAYNKFESFKRPAGMNIIDFLYDLEKLYNINNIKKIDIELPTRHLLKTVSILEDNQQVGRDTFI